MPDDYALFWYLFGATKGGPNRLRIVRRLFAGPYNTHQLAQVLHLDYKTIQHHLETLVENGILLTERPPAIDPSSGRRVPKRYGELYRLSPFVQAHKKTLQAIWEKLKKAEMRE